MSQPSVMEHLGEAPARRERWAAWIALALLLSAGIHALFIWWARQYTVKTFSDSYYEHMVPRAFKVDRVEVDARLLDENAEPAATGTAKPAQAPVDLPAEDIASEPTATQMSPGKPAELKLAAEPAPKVGMAAAATASNAGDEAKSFFEEDLQSMREALLAESPASSAQPAIGLADAAAGQDEASAGGAVPAGYSDLDQLLAQTGGLSPSQAPIFMPSDVLFGYDESFLRPEAISSLEKLGELIRRNPASRFRIEGHTDSFGGPDYNARLSLARAESVKQWLMDRMAIDPSRMETRGLGNTKPLVPGTGSIEDQKLNRRVEIVILRPAGG